VTNFSNLEYELMEHERKLDLTTTTPVTTNQINSSNNQANGQNNPFRRYSFLSVAELDEIFHNQSYINSNINGGNTSITTQPPLPSSLSPTSPSTSNSANTNFTCIIDRNRMIKYTSKSKSAHVFPQSTSIISNVNIFYELLQSMPELSKLEIK
jgi:hypothetical protein